MRWAEVRWSIVRVEAGQLRGLPDVVANILFFMPLGVAFAFTGPGTRLADPVRVGLGAGLIGGALSLGVEVLQLFTRDRTTSLGDLVFNAGGCAVAAGVAAEWRRSVGEQVKGFLEREAGRDVRRVHAGLLLGLLALGGLVPFDVTLDIGALKAGARAFLADPVGLTGLTDVVLVFIPWCVAGVALAGALPVHRGWRRVAGAGAVALVVGGVVEIGQFFIASRVPGVGEACVAGVAGLVGGALRRPLEGIAARHGHPLDAPLPAGELVRAGPRLAFGAFVLYVALDALRPFTLIAAEDIDARLSWDVLVPFGGYYANMASNVLTDLLVGTATYAALGYAVAARRCPPGLQPTAAVYRAAMGAACILAFGLEAMQIAVEGRTVELSDVYIAGFGGWAGVRAYRAVAAFDPRRNGSAATGPRSDG
jgi:glycopeptide antibiotics resistance protein